VYFTEFKPDGENHFQDDTCHVTKELREGLEVNKEVKMKQEIEQSAEKGDLETDSEKNVESIAGNFTKWMTDLQESVELAGAHRFRLYSEYVIKRTTIHVGEGGQKLDKNIRFIVDIVVLGFFLKS
jgi:hypothetical protein